MGHMREVTQGSQLSGSRCLWVEQTGTGAQDLDSSYRVSLGNEPIGWTGTFGDEICTDSAISVCQCTGTVVIEAHEKWPDRRKEA